MQLADAQPDAPRPADLLVTWLTAQIHSLQSPQIDQQYPPLPPQTRSERISLLRDVIVGDRVLALAVRRLPIYEQMRLTVEALATNVVLEPSPTHVAAQTRILQDPVTSRVAPYQKTPPFAGRHARRRRPPFLRRP